MHLNLHQRRLCGAKTPGQQQRWTVLDQGFRELQRGKLKYWYQDDGKVPLENMDTLPSYALDLKEGICAFDGHRAHEVTPYVPITNKNNRSHSAERYSLVFFVHKHADKLTVENHQSMIECGFVTPTTENISAVRDLIDPPVSSTHWGMEVVARQWIPPNVGMPTIEIIAPTEQVAWNPSRSPLDGDVGGVPLHRLPRKVRYFPRGTTNHTYGGPRPTG